MKPFRKNQAPQETSRRAGAAVSAAGILLFAAVLLFLFSRFIFGKEQFAYRDAGYYHYPFARQIVRETSAGRLPLWDPYENLGVPLAGNPAAALFYPMRAAVFALSGNRISFDAAFKFYVLFHLAAAFGAFLYLARTPLSVGEERKRTRPLCRPLGAVAGALAWTFSGQVLFQVTNVPFLIGAAWLPLLVGALMRLLICPALGSGLAAACAIALMITGGDPQTALLGTLTAIPLWLFCRTGNGSEGGTRPVRSLAALVGATLFGLALAAVQVFPAAETALGSSRTRSADETPAERLETEMAAYNFSLPPWRAAELLWPGIGGREFPFHTRWLTVIPGDRQIWTPSIYMGLFSLAAAVSSLRFCFRRRRQSFPGPGKGKSLRGRMILVFSYLALLSFLAAWGGFGGGWLVRAFREPGLLPSAPFQPADPVGGVYWLMKYVVPGWGAFRYPAKMMTMTTLFLSLLAGLGWERLFRARRTARCVWILLGLFLLGFLTILYINPIVYAKYHADPDRVRTLYGPLIPNAAKMCEVCALAQTAFFTLLLAALPLLRKLPFAPRWRNALPALVGLLILALDLAVSQKWMMRGAPERVFRTSSPIAAELHRRAAGRAAPPRFFRDAYLYPADFLNASSYRRLEERVRWDRLTLFQKNAAVDRAANIDVRGTFVPSGYLSISRYLRSELRRWRMTGEKGAGLDRMLAALGADALLVSAGRIRFDAVPRGGERVHIVHRPERFKAWQDLVRHRLEEEPLEGESAEMTCYEPERIEIGARLTRPGTLLIAEQYWPGWQARVKEEPDGQFRSVPIRRIAAALRAIDLPEGVWRVEMRYRPVSLRVGTAVTAAAFVLLILLGTSACRKPSGPASSPSDSRAGTDV